jgi:hypothetical protein
MTKHQIPCIDCRAEFKLLELGAIGSAPSPMRPRPTPHPGPRCATHWHDEVKRRKAAAHGKAIERTYGLTAEQYQQLKELQGGACAICQRARGISKRLAVDHDHQTGKVRGLLCGPCNKMLGHARDNPGFFARAIYYLNYPPSTELT